MHVGEGGREKMALPRYLVLQSKKNNKYLSYVKEGTAKGRIQCSGESAVSPCAKFEVEKSKTSHGLVNIRSCYNNKYWDTKCKDWIPYIEASAAEPDDKSSVFGTQFEPLFVDRDSIQLRQVKFKRVACTSGPNSTDDDFLKVGIWIDRSMSIPNSSEFRIIDWESLLHLPKYVAFKGDNGRYLSGRWIERHPYLQFASDNIDDPTVANEVFMNGDGSVRIKSNCFGKFWRLSPCWIWADSDDTSSNNADTVFWPVKVDGKNTIALRNLGINRYCKRLTTERKTSCLNAAVSTITREAKLEVEELVLSRSIFNVRYRLMDARIYDKTILTMGAQEATNYSHTRDDSMSLKFAYETKETNTWSTSLSIKRGFSFEFKTGVPEIAQQSITVSSEFTTAYQWGETREKTQTKESTYSVLVPPRSTVNVRLVATKGTCDVPFSYSVRDTLYSGEQITYTKDDGLYTGVNCFNFDYVKD